MNLPRVLAFLLLCSACLAAVPSVERHAVHEVTLHAEGTAANPYAEQSATAIVTEPDGTTTHRVPMFWDVADSWRFRISPDKTGRWQWKVSGAGLTFSDEGGVFEVTESKRHGGLQPMRGHSHHFQREDGTPVWFMGDTAWALVTDNETEKHDRAAAFRYLDARVAQGFNAVHVSLLSEVGWGNAGGRPFEDLSTEKLNPAYWREVDTRIAYANSRGITVGLALAWGDKNGKQEFAWRRFPSLEARKRYARYIGARYSAHDVYFLVSGEWHAEIRTRKSTEEEVRREFIQIGNALNEANAHHRMVGIHPMTQQGSTREFNAATWMSFGDYQQNYKDLHGRALESRQPGKPVVNSEYGYLLRDSNGDGTPDKDNSQSTDIMRHATWDIVMAGGYVVTGFGTTYFGGERDPGPFDLEASKNDDWEAQMGHMKKFFETFEWWKLSPRDELVRCGQKRTGERKVFDRTAPPECAWWCLADDAGTVLVHARGITAPLSVKFQPEGGRKVRARLLDPRTGETKPEPVRISGGQAIWTPPDAQDWVLALGQDS